MAGKVKRGLDYAGWNTDIFENDTKIDQLIDAQGWIGFCIYFYLCQKAYASDGYFFRWSYDNAPTTARKMGGGIRSKTVEAAVGTCSRVGLFDKRLLDVEGILTSKGIQRRFLEATKRRTEKAVNKDYWLLDPKESDGVVFAHQNSECCNKDGDFCNKDGDLRNKNAPIKESKVKESKDILIEPEKIEDPAPQEDDAFDVPEKKGGGRIRYQTIVDMFHETCRSLPRVQKLTDKRKKGIRARLKAYSLDEIQTALAKAEASDFMTGRSGGNWKADFEWFFVYGDNNIAKVLEGKYDNKGSNQPQGASAKYDPSIFERLEYENREDFA